MKSIYAPRYISLIEHLIIARNGLNKTQVDLAALLGKHQSYVAKVENFDRRIDVVELADWLNALGICPSKFMSEVTWWD
jgi:transcriptional regulator with XRE-family HTH domain